jgi:hypothetical protein
MIKQALIALALSGAVASAQAGVVVNEGFNDVTTLGAKGWVMTNASTPGGVIPGWFQGDQTTFPAQAGSAESYIAANYANAGSGGTLNNWLITPEFSNETPVFISLWLRAADDANFSDQVAFGFSSNGSSAIADFTVATPFTVLTNDWTRYDLYFGARGTGATGRFAIQYTGAADFSNYVGVDSLTVTVPEPSTMLVMMTGLMGVAAMRRRQRR